MGEGGRGRDMKGGRVRAGRGEKKSEGGRDTGTKQGSLNTGVRVMRFTCFGNMARIYMYMYVHVYTRACPTKES